MKLQIFALLSAALVGTSCQKISETPPPLGPAVDAESIQDEFRKVEQNIDPFGAKVGDALGLMMNAMVEHPENLQTMALLKRRVTEKNETPTSVEFKIRNQDFSVEDGVATEVRDEICTMTLTTRISYSCPSWENASEEDLISGAQTRNLLNQKLNQQKEVGGSAEGPVERRYHNLQVANETIKPPQVVRERENCSGLSPCSIRLHHIQYDEVERYADGSLRRKRWNYALTSDLRYLGTEGVEYQTCVTETVEVGTRPILLKQCLFVYDLIKVP